MKKELLIAAALLVAGSLSAAIVPGFAQDASSAPKEEMSASFDCVSASSALAESSEASLMSEYSEYCPASSAM